MSIAQNLAEISASIPNGVALVAVSKTKPLEDLQEAYDAGQRVFGENKIQEMADKHEALPKDIEWHMIGHVQTNKVKYMAPFVSLVHGVDSLKLLKEINKRALQNERTIDVLLQMHIAEETTKFGLNSAELSELLASDTFSEMQNVRVRGLMGMATFTEDNGQVQKEFNSLKSIFDNCREHQFEGNTDFDTLSMGMSGDYKLAISCGSTMVRIGSSIFGARNYTT